MGGNRQEKTHKAITQGCHELQDEDIIVYKDEKIKWGAFKAKFFRERKWYLDCDEEMMKMQRKKNALIWNLIGEKICEYY